MTRINKIFAVSVVTSFALGIISKIYFNYLEYQAKQDLPIEMRTNEAIQQYYDGAVCLSCDIMGIFFSGLFFAVALLSTILLLAALMISKDSNRRRLNL